MVTKKPAPEYPTAGAGVGVRVYSDRGKRIGPVFSSVEKAQGYLSNGQGLLRGVIGLKKRGDK